jgi:hypothetical protein
MSHAIAASQPRALPRRAAPHAAHARVRVAAAAAPLRAPHACRPLRPAGRRAAGSVVAAAAGGEPGEPAAKKASPPPATDEEPPWVRRERERELQAGQPQDLPFGLYLLASVIVAIAAVRRCVAVRVAALGCVAARDTRARAARPHRRAPSTSIAPATPSSAW